MNIGMNHISKSMINKSRENDNLNITLNYPSDYDAYGEILSSQT